MGRDAPTRAFYGAALDGGDAGLVDYCPSRLTAAGSPSQPENLTAPYRLMRASTYGSGASTRKILSPYPAALAYRINVARRRSLVTLFSASDTWL